MQIVLIRHLKVLIDNRTKNCTFGTWRNELFNCKELEKQGFVCTKKGGGSNNPELCNRNHQPSNSHCAVGIYKKSSPNLWVKLKFFTNTHNTSTITNFGNPIA